MKDSDFLFNPFDPNNPNNLEIPEVKIERLELFEKEMENVKEMAKNLTFKKENVFYWDSDMDEKYEEDEVHTMFSYNDTLKHHDVETTYKAVRELFIKQKEKELKIKHFIN